MSAASTRPVPTPASVGRFEILLPIARGGMATVYLARSRGARGFERHVAVKLSHPHLADGSFATVLLDEANLAARIRHKNVVSILDVGEDPLGLFMVMDYVEGDTLGGLQSAARKQKRVLPLDVGLRIFLDALAGLHAAHELAGDDGRSLGVVHRDFSPQNVLVGLDGVAQLTDFGVAKALGHGAHTSTGVIKGKVAYMAPEHARGHELDRRADVWSAGVVLWELVAGVRMHPESDGVALLLKVVSETPPLLRTVKPEVPPALEAVVARALSVDPSERHPTAAAFADALQRALTDGMSGLRVADHAEVARMVQELAGPKLAERRASVEEAVRLRKDLDALAVRSVDGALATPSGDLLLRAAVEPPTIVSDSSVPTLPKEVRAVPLASVPSPAVSAPRARLRGRVLGGAVAALALVGAAAVWLGRAPAASVPPALASAAPSASGLVAPALAAPAAESAAPVEIGLLEETVDVSADAPVASLRIGDRSIALTSPTSTVTFTRTEKERGRLVKVEVFAADGRRAAASLPAAATSLKIVFPGRPANSPARGACDPPYTLSPDGVRIPKRQCF